MKQRLSIYISFLLVLLSILPAVHAAGHAAGHAADHEAVNAADHSAEQARTSVLYKNASLINPEYHAVSNNTYLWVENGRFSYVGQQRPEVPAGTEVVNLQGSYLTPGFIDTHAHISLGAVSFTIENDEVLLYADNQRSIAEWNAAKLLQFGVTSIRNPGGDTRANLDYRKAQRAGDILGPRAFVAGSIINSQPFAGLAVAVDGEMSIREAVAYQAGQGVDYIKLYTELNAEQVAVAVGEAQRHELPVIGHLDALSWQRGAELGIEYLVHAMPISADLLPEAIREDYLVSARHGTHAFFEWFAAADLQATEITSMIATLQAQQTSVDPTLIVFRNAFYGDSAEVTAHAQLDYAHPELVQNWQEFYHFNLGWTEEDFANAQATWPKVLQFVKQLHEADVLLSVGTDLGNPWVIPGVSYFEEMNLLADAGISPMDILSMATTNGARVLGQEHQLGRVAAGYVADFVVFGANPAESLDNLTSIELVLQGGEVVFTK